SNALALGTEFGNVRLWDVAARAPLTDGVQVGSRVAAVAVGVAEAEYVVVVCPERGPAIVYKCGRPFVAPPVRLSAEPGKEVLGVAFSGDGTTLYVTSPYGVSRWSTREGKRYGPERDYSSASRFGEPAGAQARFSAGAVRGQGAGQADSILVGGTGGRMFVVDAKDAPTMKSAPGGAHMSGVAAPAPTPSP